MISNPEGIKSALLLHFKNFLSNPTSSDIFILQKGLVKELSLEDKSRLVEPFSLPEIEAALHSMESSKAPGPDGINAGVIKFLWNEVKGDYLQLFSDF